MTYNFYKRLGAIRGYEAERLFQRSVRAGWSFNKLQRESMKTGLSYKRKDMQYDLRRAQAIMFSKTMDNRIRASSFFDKFYEPTRIKHNWHSKETTDFFRRGRLGMLETMEEMEEYEEIMHEVEEEYPEKYPKKELI